MDRLSRYTPWAIFILALLYVLSSMRPQPVTPGAWRTGTFGRMYQVFATLPKADAQSQMKLAAFGALPIQDQGRIKPIDTYARNHLLSMNRRQDFKDNDGSTQPATRWLLNLLAEGIINTIATVNVSDPVVQDWIGLDKKPDGRYHAEEVREAIMRKRPQFLALDKKKDRSPLEDRVMQLAAIAFERANTIEEMNKPFEKNEPKKQKVFRIDYDQILSVLKLEPRDGFRYSVEEITSGGKTKEEAANRQAAFQEFLRMAFLAEKKPEDKRDTTDLRALELMGQLRKHMGLSSMVGVTLVPDETFASTGWKTLAQAIHDNDEQHNPNAKHLMQIVLAYARGDAKTFNAAVDAYSTLAAEELPSTGRAKLEAWFNHFAPFYRCAFLYILTFILAVLSWGVWHKPLWRSALLLVFLVFVVHTAALILRMWIQGRPPVTNLYSSAVFIGWGCTLTCLVMELIYRNAVPIAVGSMLGFMTMVIAHHLGGSGDTMEVLQAVLDTNFWLATHVTIVTLGYTATFVAGFAAMVFLFMMLASTVLAFFRNRTDPSWQNIGVFSAAISGMAFLVVVVVNFALLGLWYMVFEDNPFSTSAAAVLMLPAILAALIYTVSVIMRFLAPPHPGEKPGDIPQSVSWMQAINLNIASSKALTNAIYGVTCFALLLSFVGTVLGGIWADQSWGRFWGWDPKENGAVLVVIINALILHARWGGMIRDRGLVMLALVGNMVTMWSWFGTNQLGIGLHAYGFNKALVVMCTTFWVCQCIMIALASLPAKYWKSYAAMPTDKKAAKALPKAKTGDARVVPASS